MRVNIEVAYAVPGDQFLFELTMPEGATVSSVLETCSADALLPDDVLRDPEIGVFGRAVASSYVLRAGDRVEFYRPLKADPKEARRRRASVSRRRGGGTVGEE